MVAISAASQSAYVPVQEPPNDSSAPVSSSEGKSVAIRQARAAPDTAVQSTASTVPPETAEPESELDTFVTASHGFVTDPLRKYYEGLDSTGKRELLRHQLYLTQTTFGAKRILALGDLKEKFLQDDAATKLNNNTPEQQKFLTARRQMTLDVLQSIFKNRKNSEVVDETVKAARKALIDHEDPDFSVESDLDSLNSIQRKVIERIEDYDSDVGDDIDAYDKADVQKALSRFFAQSPLSPRDADVITTGPEVLTQAFGDVGYLPYLLCFNDSQGPFRRTNMTDSALNAAYEIAFNSKELQGFRAEVRALADRPSQDGGTLEARREYRNATALALPVSAFKTEPYINAELQKIDPELFAVTELSGYQSSEHFTQETLSNGVTTLAIAAQGAAQHAAQTTLGADFDGIQPGQGSFHSQRPEMSQIDIGFFKQALLAQIPDEPTEFLDDADRYDPVFSSGKSTFRNPLGGFYNVTEPLARTYSYRAKNGELFIYNPWPPGYKERQKLGQPPLLQKVNETPGNQEYSDGEIMTYLGESLQYTRRDNVVIVPKRKQATAASVAQKRGEVVFPFGMSETVKKVWNLNLSPRHTQDVDQFFQKNRDELVVNVSQSLDAIPVFTTIAQEGELNSTEQKRIQGYLYEFLDGKRKALRGSASKLSLSGREEVLNPNTLFLPTGEDEQFSGMLINLNQQKIAVIPKGLKAQLALFKSEQFREIFAEGIDAKTKGEMASKLKKMEQYNSGKYLTNPSVYLKALEARGGKFYVPTSDNGRMSAAPVNRARVNEADTLAQDLSDYVALTASGLVSPNDEDIDSIVKIADILSEAPRKSGAKEKLVDFTRTLYLNKIKQSATGQSIDELKSKDSNPIVSDWKNLLKSDWDYNTTSAWEKSTKDALRVLRPALTGAGYALSVGLSVAFPGVAAGVIAGVAATAVTDIAADAAELAATDDLEERDRLARGMVEKFYTSIAAEMTLGGATKAIAVLAKQTIGRLVRKSASQIEGVGREADVSQLIRDIETAVDAEVKNLPVGPKSKAALRGSRKPAASRQASDPQPVEIGSELAELLVKCADNNVSQLVWSEVYKQSFMHMLASNPEGFSGDYKALLKAVQGKIAAEAAKGGRISLEQSRKILDAGNRIEESKMVQELLDAGVIHKNTNGLLTSLIEDRGAATFNRAETASPSGSLDGQRTSPAPRRNSDSVLAEVSADVSGLKYGLGIGEPESLITEKHVKMWKAGFKGWKPKQLQDVADVLDELQGKNLDTVDAQALLVKLGEKLNALSIPADPSSRAFQEKTRLLATIDWHKPMSSDEIDAYVTANRTSLFPPVAEGDLADPAVRQMRETILKRKMKEEGYSRHRLEISRGLSRRGTSFDDRQWTGLRLCQEATAALGGPVREYTPANSGSNITTNHFIIDNGKTWRDPTWKQFFSESETLGKPPIFNGTAEQFRAMGLDRDRTESYLKLIRKAKITRFVPRVG
ncbi:hypothetical protein [Ensifer sp. SL37]|uniref:hypothetical protein n=1 Tax=Ensifer sp. SL37 TaxID=2995137 RepID=UPI0022766D23|nr:hypothetical protein [Ensifer sp. SL37]MCY1740822.1 hypothetical protein [Ensifer sp. SL37]